MIEKDVGLKKSNTSAILVVLLVIFNIAAFFFTDLDIAGEWGPISSTLVLLVRVVVLLGVVLIAYVRPLNTSSIYVTLIAFSVLFFFLRMLALFVPEFAHPAVIFLAAGALGGASGCGLLLAGASLSLFTSERARSIILVGFFAASLLTLVSRILPLAIGAELIGMAFFFAFLIFATLVFVNPRALALSYPSAKEVLATSEGRYKSISVMASKGTVPLVTLLASLFLSFVFGLFEVYFFESKTAEGSKLFSMIVIVVLYGVLFLVNKRANTRTYFNGIFLGICIATIISIPFVYLSTAFSPLLFTVLLTTISILHVPIWIFLVDISYEKDVPPLYLFGLAGAVLALAHMLGRLSSWALSLQWEINDQFASNLALAVLLVIALIAVIALALVLRSKNSAQEPAAPREPVKEWNTEFQELCTLHAFTERERDIIHLYAQGRSVPFISKELFIAKSTVKTHIGNVYARLGIHTKQELMDILGTVK
jgi:DNA-binding CsgD family transcriptional regulator